MCSFTQREYGCGHYRFIASKWCHTYSYTHKRCAPRVTHFECVQDLCGDCKSKMQPPVPWENLIRRPRKQFPMSFL